MIALKRILVPTDFSPTSEIAVKYARALAEAFGASLHLLHVLESPLLQNVASEVYVPPPDFYEEWERAVRERLDRVVPAAERGTLALSCDVRTGSPFVEIVQFAREQDIDLIVLGTHGRGAVAHMFLGSVAERVVRKAPCPVLTVRHPEHEFVQP
ncbi:MAG TPA: universal stress protein [Vicinamibacterales bacterium]|nr:universal stress protein [Vicinamibacterales bacterium]